MKTIEIKIKGTTPLMLNRFTEANEQETKTRKALMNHGTPRERAENATYKDDAGRFFFPGSAIARLLREAGSNHKMRGSRKSAKFVVPAAVMVMDDAVLIRNGDGESLAQDFEVDSRPVVIPATKGRIMAHRPRWDCWSAKLSIRVNEDLLPVDFVNQLLVEGSQQIGIGAYRPEKGGPFGTFMITGWAQIS